MRTRLQPPALPWLWVGLGVVGILLVALGPIIDSNGLLEHPGAWWRMGLTVPGHLLVLWSWWQLGPLWRRPGVTAAIWSAAMIAVPPLHSRDAFSYAAQGWLRTRGRSPYDVVSGDAGDPGLLVGVHWWDTTSVYPPLSIESFRLVSWLFDGHLFWTPVGMRLPNVVAIVVLIWALRRLADRIGVRGGVVVWAGVLNPVVLVQWVGGVHNDAVMIAALAVAFLLAGSSRWRGWQGMLLGGAGIGLAMAIKQSAAVAGVGLVALAWAAAQQRLPAARRTWWALLSRTASAGAMAVLTFVAISFATGLGLGWNNATAGNPLMASSNAPLSWLASFLRYRELAPENTVITGLTVVSAVLVVAGVVWAVVRYGPRPPEHVGHPWALVIGVLTAYAVLGPGLQPWYATWIIPFVALARPSRPWAHGFVVATVLASVIPALQDVVPPYVAMGILLVPGWFLWRWLRARDTAVLPPQTVV